MIKEEEAQSLILKFIDLREKVKKGAPTEVKAEFRRHKNLCMQKFRYLIDIRTRRYRNFNNYEDLNQEGFEALLKSIESYKPEKGIFFYWAHKYIETRIARSANLHTAIRFPLKYAKIHTPHKESKFPVMLDTNNDPDQIMEDKELRTAVESSLNQLTSEQKELVSMVFGFNGHKPQSLAKICKENKLSRQHCQRTITTALEQIKETIKL